MSAALTSKDGQVQEELANQTWQAVTDIGGAFRPDVPRWNGCHDGQEWTPKQLLQIADVLHQVSELLTDFAAHGGVTIS